ncbi:hypothetical protein PR003_g18806 [Phytophthora rubi]|uniref:Uncharacterized protein n=1 Tax=Phytophthora rubi TaxID=129364 RepID=A0A6A4E0Z3_9STRA|nr:hypothetical protein PR001_g2785 [Phytophthora rubi]KAE9316129.1 hypothetical protein PR003_g18806 [Phytophthora rubi]
MLWRKVTLFLGMLVILGSEWDPVFANTEASSSTSGNAVETDQVAVQSNASASSALSPTSKVTNASVSTVSGTAVLEATASGSSTLDADTTSTTTSLLPNWVGTVDPSDNVCYRQTYISRTCSTGYAYDKIATCWAQCPMNYPVQCGMECIPQNDDCALSVATVALNAATSGVFGQLSTASAAVQQGVKCGQKLFTVVKNIVNYAEKLQTQFPNGTEEQIISLLNNSDIVIKDLPTAVSVCLGLDVPTDYLNLASEVVGVVKKCGGCWHFDEDDTSTLEKLISEGETCGTELQSIITKVTQAVAGIKSADATSPASAIRLALSDTALFLTEIPTVTNNCIRNITSTSDAYTVRDKIRKALSVITDNLIDSSDDGKGNALSKAEYILKVADMGLDVIAMFDPTGIAKLLEEFIQPVCGPTSFIGEIDDGSLTDALALVADGNAFAGSYGTWTHTGDGAVNIVFENTDTKDVTVEIHSAGETIDSVKVKRGKTVPWNSTVSVLQDKTMYFDRWRPGLLGLPGSGGGSLVMWVPRSSEGGHIDLVAKINVS